MSKSDSALWGALKALRSGRSVIALWPKSKKPTVKSWQQKPFRSARALKSYFKSHPDTNFGILTGVKNGVIALDPDGAQGIETLETLETKHGALPDTVTVETPGGGRHLYFSARDADIGNSAGKLGYKIDVRGTGGFVVAAGSVHPNGGTYRYMKGKALGGIEIADLPKWIIKKLTKGKRQTPVPASRNTAKATARQLAYAARALEGEAQRVSVAPIHQRNDTLNRSSFRLGQLVAHDFISAAAVTNTLKAAALKCGLTEAEINPTIESGLSAGEKSPRRIKCAFASKEQPKTPAGSKLTERLAKLGETDADNAERFIERFRHQAMWTAALGWLVYDGTRWKVDVENARLKLAMKMARLIKFEATFLDDKTGRKKFSNTSLNKGAIDRFLALAQPQMVADDANLDRDIYLLNLANGTIDLRTGELRPHDPTDLITRLCPKKYAPQAKSRAFKTFLRDTTGGNKDVMRFLKKAIGYSMTGSGVEQVMFCVHGPTKTGKSTLVNLVRDILGEYAINTATKELLVKHFDSDIPVGLARMKGMRMVTAIESNVNQQFDEAKIKSMTGGDKQTARFMRQNPFDFTPEFKLWLVANDMPRVRATDDAIWERLVIIPFKNQLPEEKREKDLPEKLREDAEAIIAWAVRGAVLWSKEGLKDKSLFDGDKALWRASSDTITLFLQECCQLTDPSEHIGSAVLHGRYKQWCASKGEKPASTKEFKRTLTEKNYVCKKTNKAMQWVGLKIVK